MLTAFFDREKHMRKLKVEVQISLDGFIAGPRGEMDWMVWDWDDALKRYVEEITEPVDCIVLGRNLAQGFIPHWAKVAANPDNPEFESGTIVPSRKLYRRTHQNTKSLRSIQYLEINV